MGAVSMVRPTGIRSSTAAAPIRGGGRGVKQYQRPLPRERRASTVGPEERVPTEPADDAG